MYYIVMPDKHRSLRLDGNGWHIVTQIGGCRTGDSIQEDITDSRDPRVLTHLGSENHGPDKSGDGTETEGKN